MSHPAIHFYDAANPANVPSGVYAAVYINGFAWPQSEINRMARIFKISVERSPLWAEKARCIDIENGAALPVDAAPFVQHRINFLKAHGLHFNDSVVYVNRSNRGDVQERLAHAGLHAYNWVATLDGTDLDDAWAVQLQTVNGAYDLSRLHGVNDFRKP